MVSNFHTKYKLLAKTNRDGGYGRIYHVKCLTDDKTYIAKVERISLLMELDILSRFDHKHILHLVDFFIQDNIPELAINKPSIILILPLAKTDLYNYNLMTLSLANRISIMHEIASAIFFLTQHRVLHLDIKPGNILLFDDNSIKLADFGLIAYQTGNCYCQKNNPVFSFTHRPPEEFINIKFYSDINTISVIKARPKNSLRYLSDRTQSWALGLLFYELLTGKYTYSSLAHKKGNEKDFIRVLMTEIFVKRDIFLSRIEDSDARELIDNMLKFNRNERLHIKDIFLQPFFKKYNISYPILGQIIEAIPSIVNDNKINTILVEILAINMLLGTRNELLFLSVDICYRCWYALNVNKIHLYLAGLKIAYHILNDQLSFKISSLYPLYGINKKSMFLMIKKMVLYLKGFLYQDNYYNTVTSNYQLAQFMPYLQDPITYIQTLNTIRGKSLVSDKQNNPSKDGSSLDLIKLMSNDDYIKVFNRKVYIYNLLNKKLM